MDEIKLSIIVPCFDVPLNTLRQCVESMEFIGSIMPFEVWVIDDGSQANEIVPFIEALGNPSFHAIRQKNMGPGGARNTGIELSRGEYITFVDADDYILYGPYIEMLKVLQRRKPDILCQGCLRHYEGSATRYMMDYDIIPTCWAYFIKRSVLGDLRFTPYIIHEDEEFCTKLHLLRAHLITLNYDAYFYRYRQESVMHCSDDGMIRKRFDDYVTVIHNLQSLDIKEPHRRALMRRIDILGMCYVVDLMRDAKNNRQARQLIAGLRSTGLYPLPFRWHGFRYSLIMFTTRVPGMILLVRPLIRIIMKLRYGTTQKRALTPHVDLVNADEPEV